MGVKKEENEKSQKAKTGSKKARMNSGKNGEQWQWQEAILPCSISFVFSALLSFWSLICNVEFDSNSLCLDRLNNFGINSFQKLQNYPSNAISRIAETLMCKSG